MLIAATPRPDIALTVLQDRPLLTNFIAWDVFPVFDVGVSTGPIPKILRRARVERLFRSRYGNFPRGSLEVVAAGTFDCKETGFEEPYDAKDIEMYRGEDNCQRVMGNAALRNVMVAHESGVANTLMTTTVFGSGYNAAAAAAWDNPSGKPLDDAASAKEAVLKSSGMEPNVLIIGAGVYTKLKKNPQIQTQVRAVMGYTDKEGGITLDISPKDLAVAFGVERVLIGKATYDTADEGQTSSMAFIWPSDKALFAYIPDPNDEFAPHLGRTFVWDQGLMEWGDTVVLQRPYQGLMLETYVENKASVGIVRVKRHQDTLMLNKDSGYLVTGC